MIRVNLALLVSGILFLVAGIYQLPSRWIFKSDLITIKGTLRSADIYITNVTDRKGRESRKSEMIFYLYGRSQKFRLAENIGKEYRNKEYERILRGLKVADTIKVVIRRNETEAYEPDIYRIDYDNATLLDKEDEVFKGRAIVLFLLLTGPFLLVLLYRNTFYHGVE